MVSLCFICGFLLAVVAYTLRTPQMEAKEFDQSKQMLIAAKILNHAGYFELLQEDGALVPAEFDPSAQILVPSEEEGPVKATDDQIKAIAELRIRPLLTDKEGNVSTLEAHNITLSQYLAQNQKTGYANLPQKLFYVILPNEKTEKDALDLTQAYAIVIPISGFGLWGPIYGYIAVSSDGDEVIGTTWYDHGETPGLGANIAEAWWQKQFFKKLIFQEAPDGSTDFQTADMGIFVVKGKVSDVLSDSPKSKSAVDGISGATITGDGVSAAYKNSLTPYREFFIKLREKEEKQDG